MRRIGILLVLVVASIGYLWAGTANARQRNRGARRNDRPAIVIQFGPGMDRAAWRRGNRRGWRDAERFCTIP